MQHALLDREDPSDSFSLSVYSTDTLRARRFPLSVISLWSLHGSRYSVFPRGRNTLWRFAMCVCVCVCVSEREMVVLHPSWDEHPIVRCTSLIPLLRERSPLPSLISIVHELLSISRWLAIRRDVPE